MLKVVSWNIDGSSAGTEARATAALEHLQELFGEVKDPFIVMFQEVRRESLQVILENPWVQRNFVLSNTKAPERYIRASSPLLEFRSQAATKWYKVTEP